ncbi:hypothetical protein PPSIR1_08576 [Plesiocystis pacifica SIR-1]|uniref:Lipoprotein n=1 Tax=Plesiocystis pacifica SIR-1 TaxID=391625 RepID=A6G792_9BACT|nr:hypothetical protein [Plesiocystis pacifica]EDM78226.1 hypothetical protein PPSIR1_08576 [Plesiocystis pacifica SIR-1]
MIATSCACSLLALGLLACDSEADESALSDDGDVEADCSKIYVDPMPEMGPGDHYRLIVEVYAYPKGDVHGGRAEIDWFYLDAFDGVNCYDLDDAAWPSTGPNSFDWSFVLDAYIRDTNTNELLDGYFQKICPLSEDCQPEDFDPPPDIDLGGG